MKNITGVKKTAMFGVAVALFGLSLCMPQAKAAITGSKHDFSTQDWIDTTRYDGGQICLPCHSPHGGNAAGDALGGPLWNHTITTATYTIYSSATLNATDFGQPSGVTKLCLSCHDGTVSKDSFGHGGKNSPVTGTQRTDRSTKHPVSFTYDAALASADGGLNDPTTTTTVNGKTIDEELLRNHKMECVSCHEPHAKYASRSMHFIRIPLAKSQLCLTCHAK